MSLNRYRLRHQANNGHKAAQRTARLLENPDRLISLILLGNNFVNILASAIATVIALRLMGEAGIAVATGGMNWRVGELLPPHTAGVGFSGAGAGAEERL